MAIDPSGMSGNRPGSQADAFLMVEGKRQGVVKGEASARGHEEQIGVLAWQWGVSAPTAPGQGPTTGRRIYQSLQIDKGIDRASTSLLSALATNEELKKVTLSLRKAGTDKDDFFTIVLTGGRVTACDMAAAQDGSLYESVKFAFRTVEVTYHPQQSTGARAGAFVFSDEILSE